MRQGNIAHKNEAMLFILLDPIDGSPKHGHGGHLARLARDKQSVATDFEVLPVGTSHVIRTRDLKAGKV